MWARVMAVCALAGIASAGELDINGDTTGGPVWTRPVEGFGALSGVATEVPYQVWVIAVTEAGEYDFQIEAAAFDTYLFLYSQFNPLNALGNGVASDDDRVGLLSGFAAPMVAGDAYFAVVTGFANEDFGPYRLHIEGPGEIRIVPGAGAAACLGVAALGASRRRRATASMY